MKPLKLRERHYHILSFINDHIQEHGFSPTIREICISLGGISTSVANYNLCRLIRHGYLVSARFKSRTLQLTSLGRAYLNQTPPDGLSPLERYVQQLEKEVARLRHENQLLQQATGDFSRRVHARQQ